MDFFFSFNFLFDNDIVDSNINFCFDFNAIWRIAILFFIFIVVIVFFFFLFFFIIVIFFFLFGFGFFFGLLFFLFFCLFFNFFSFFLGFSFFLFSNFLKNQKGFKLWRLVFYIFRRFLQVLYPNCLTKNYFYYRLRLFVLQLLHYFLLFLQVVLQAPHSL